MVCFQKILKNPSKIPYAVLRHHCYRIRSCCTCPFMNLTMVTDLCSIGTLFAFVLVCAGVLKLETMPDAPRGKFKTPYVNSRYIMPALVILAIVLSFTYNKENVEKFLGNESRLLDATTFVSHLNKEEAEYARYEVSLADPEGYKSSNGDLEAYLSKQDESNYKNLVSNLRIPETKNLKVVGMFSNTKYLPGFSFLPVCG